MNYPEIPDSCIFREIWGVCYVRDEGRINRSESGLRSIWRAKLTPKREKSPEIFKIFTRHLFAGPWRSFQKNSLLDEKNAQKGNCVTNNLGFVKTD
jgi:hypothetical protein